MRTGPGQPAAPDDSPDFRPIRCHGVSEPDVDLTDAAAVAANFAPAKDANGKATSIAEKVNIRIKAIVEILDFFSFHTRLELLIFELI